MINPGEIPQIPGDMAALTGHAAAITKVGGDFAATGQRVNAIWQGLAAFYTAPEAAQLFAATGPVQSVSGSVGEDIEAVGAALTAYATEVAEIKRQLAALQSQAGSFVSSVDGDDDWREDEGKVDQHNQLIQSVNTQVAAFFEAQRRCANTINALYGGRQYRAEDGDGQVQDGEYGFTADVLDAAAGEGGVLPWGSSEEHDRGFVGDVGAYFGGVGDSFTTMVGDLGSLIGRDPETGGWSWSTAGTAWTGVGTFVYAVGIYSNPLTIMVDQTGGMPGFERGGAGDLLLGAGKSLIAYDEWGEDKSRAGGMATFNIVSAIVGTKGAGAGLRGAGTAANVVRNSATAVRVSSGLIRAGNFIDNLPSAAQIATNISAKFKITIPKFQFGPILAFADGPPPGGHRFDVEMPPPRRPETFNMDAGNGSNGGNGNGSGVDGSGGNRPGGSEPIARGSDPNAPGNGDPVGNESGGNRSHENEPDRTSPADNGSGTVGNGETAGPDRGESPGRELSPAERTIVNNRLSDMEQSHPGDFDALQRDPDKNGKISPDSKEEARIGLDLREQGRLPSDIARPPVANQGEFFSPSTGKHYDIKGLHSDWPPGSKPSNPGQPFPQAVDPRSNPAVAERFVSKIETQIFRKNRDVIIDTRNADQVAIDYIRKVVEEKGWGDHVIWYP